MVKTWFEKDGWVAILPGGNASTGWGDIPPRT